MNGRQPERLEGPGVLGLRTETWYRENRRPNRACSASWSQQLQANRDGFSENAKTNQAADNETKPVRKPRRLRRQPDLAGESSNRGEKRIYAGEEKYQRLLRKSRRKRTAAQSIENLRSWQTQCEDTNSSTEK
jgi:hypothetical protein